MSPALAQRARLLASAVSLLLLLALLGAGWLYLQLRGSLPQLDGSLALPGLAGEVRVTRDALGVPTIRGGTRADVARALGFLHGQDRFFQMDLLRRRAAGELAELFGGVALPLDRRTRPHRFRALAAEVLAASPAAHRELVDAYTAGVNRGLSALRRKPFEYYLLRSEPAAWRHEDSVLIAYAMILDLQDEDNVHELSLMTLRDQFGFEAVPFFAPLATPDDAALDGSTAALAPIPGPRSIDLREARTSTNRADPGRDPQLSLLRQADAETSLFPGSNSLALTGAHTASGSALLANDPHLNLGVPNVWYRVVMEWPTDRGDAGLTRIVGVTIPGLPFAVLGSNGHIAWGLTTAYADTNDLIAVDANPVARDLYRVSGVDELLQIEQRTETIQIKGGESETVDSSWTVWGPVIGRDQRDRPLVHRWISHDRTATNLNFIALESATSAGSAVEIAHGAGIPVHNFLVADDAGAIGWTIAGQVPQRVGFDGRLPVSWSFGDRRWNGYLPAQGKPTILISSAGDISGNIDVESRVAGGRLWTANNRLVGGAALARIGDGGYMAPARALQVRDGLAALERATPRDLLEVQLDDRALLLAPWREILLAALTPGAVKQNAARAEVRRLVEHWEGRATVDSVSYRLVRAFRTVTANFVFEPIFERCVAQTPQFNWRRFNYEPALRTLLQQKPAHLLSPRHDSWDELLLAAVDHVVAEIEQDGTTLDRATWGRHNTARIVHPLGRALPQVLARWLNLPPDQLPGDSHMPRIQNPSFGASLRFAVSPGREHEGVCHMPGGQSGHPLSRFYRAGHDAWVHGEPTPLLPGETLHTLTLTP